MTAVHPEASRQAVVEAAALVLLERMGLTPADLAAVPQSHVAIQQGIAQQRIGGSELRR